jgi:hypothetical protein
VLFLQAWAVCFGENRFKWDMGGRRLKGMSGTRKSNLLGKITVLFVICCCCLPAQGKYGGGTGGPNDPYLIYDANQMNAIGADSNDWDKHFKLMADIDLGQFDGKEGREKFNVIGDSIKAFTGVFDGNDHTISNFTYNSTGKWYIGLFGYVRGPNAAIKDLRLIQPNVDAETSWYVGSLVGYLSHGTISNCFTQSGSIKGGHCLGGLVGENLEGSILESYSESTVWGDYGGNFGGLVGRNYSGVISSCYAIGNVTLLGEGNSYAGGLVGFNRGIISNCYARGDVEGTRWIGGLVGNNSYADIYGDVVISNSYSSGNVSGGGYVGGLSGYNDTNAIVKNSFWDIETSGRTTSAGGTGKTTAEMQTASTFIAWGGDPVWTIDEGKDYPRLWWESMPGEPITEPSYGGGSGTKADPYLIYTAEQMNAIGADSNDWDKHFRLMADIDLSGYTGASFNIIGTWIPRFGFSGVFDGKDHTISNFTYDSDITSGVALFGFVRGGQIKNLGLIDPDIDTTRGYIGALVGYLDDDSTIDNCYAYGGAVSGRYNVGGLVGCQSRARITNCYSTASVSGKSQVGGLVGYNSYSTISECFSTGSVTGTGSSGGLVGRSSSSCTINNCYATGSVEGDYAGGLVGINFGTIYNCYAVGSVSETDNAGGLVGGDGGYIGLCYWDIETSGISESDGGEGKSTAEMKSMSTYEGWGYGAAWTLNEGVDYPKLAWENAPGLPIEDTPRNYGGGSGTVSDPYLIYSAEQLNTIGRYPADLASHFKLMANINLSGFSGSEFNIIGYAVGFSGIFDGNGRTIKNFTYTSPDKSRVGVFGYVNDPDSEIRNLGLIGPYIDVGTGKEAGSLLARLEYGTVSNCYVQGGTVTGQSKIGGLVAINDYGTVTNCYATAGVTGYSFVGGLMGRNSRGSIRVCYAQGGVNGNMSVGGLVGDNDAGMISICYATGNVSGTKDAGGLVGENTGAVGLSYWNIETSGLSQSAGGEGKSTAQMKSISTYQGWGYDESWTINEGVYYPRLAWENAPGTLIEDEPRYYGGGSGTASDPYLIYTAEQLNTIGRYPADFGSGFKLMADIDLNDMRFNIIGYGIPFNGLFDGNGHVVRYLNNFSELGGYMGLFGCVDSGGQVKNLGLENVDFFMGYDSRYVYIGGLMGHNSGTITNCYSVGIVAGYRYVSGLVGYNHHGTITDCFSRGGIHGSGPLGGVAGFNNSGTITGCHSKVHISGSIDDYDDETCIGAGGIAGDNTGTISNCWAAATIENGSEQVGGLVGENRGVVSNCYSTGSVECFEFSGGLVGWNHNGGTILDSYSTAEATGDYDVGGLVGSNSGPITNCYSTGSVSGNKYIGGLTGGNSGPLTNCYSVGNVSGGEYAGGLVGDNYYSTIINCYSAGSVSGDDDVGGLVGYSNGQITDSFWDIETSGLDWSDGGTGLPTDLMQTMSTFTDAGWDFVGETFNGIDDIWFIPRQDYPHLWWEGMQVPMKLTPRTLNCRSTVEDVDTDKPAVLLHSFGFESAPLYVFVNKNKLVEIEAAFERQALCSLAGDWPQELTVAGFLADGNIFLGTSTVRIIHPGMKVIEELAWYWLNEDCVQPDFCNQIDMNRDSLVNLLDYALLMNIEVEFVTDE